MWDLVVILFSAAGLAAWSGVIGYSAGVTAMNKKEIERMERRDGGK